jgi:indolepyruvate ferredoxin oxidoreductase beta subunit
VLLAIERVEALRFADFIRPGGTVVVNDMEIVPITVSAGDSVYPAAAELARVFDMLGARLITVSGERLATDAGNVKAANVVLLGAISTLLDIEEAVWWRCLAERVPQKFLEVNHAAFALGRAAAAAGKTDS